MFECEARWHNRETPSDSFQDMPAEITREAPFYSDSPGQFWLGYNFERDGIILQEILEISLPRGRSVKLKHAKSKPVVSQSGPYDVYMWTVSNLQDRDDKKQKQQQQQEQLWQRVRGRQPMPEIELSTFQNWDELGKWYLTLQRERVQPTPEIQAKAAELTKGLPDDEAKIRALYDFVSTKYRYIGIAFGIGRYQPHSAAEVLANQYGDCKDKHTLFASLLAAAGIKAYPALISSSHELDPDVPSPGQFDHIITAIPQANSILWLDTTTEVAPFGILLPPLRGKHALVIADDKPAALRSTIEDDPYPSLQKFLMDAKISDAGVLDGKAESTNHGDTEILFRAAFRVVPRSRWKDLVQRISYGLGFAGDVSDVDATPPEKTSQPFHFSYSYKRKDYSDWTNRRITPPVPPMGLPEIDEDMVPIAPIWLGSPGEIEFHATVELPKDLTPVLPQAVHVKRDFADYDATYSFSAGVITFERHLTVRLREVSLAEYSDYKSFRKAVEEDYSSYTSLSVAGAASSSRSVSNLFLYQNEIWDLPYSENTQAAALYETAREQFQRNDLAGEIDSLKKAVELDPKYTRAWLWLGEIYKSVQQSDLAIQAYRKAIEINPQLPVSYKALGFTLDTLHRNDEAITVWQQLIKVAPERADGYANLGFLLLELNRSQEAIAPLESAVRLFSGQAGLQITLGKAYLYGGESEKARAAFQAAAKLDPMPVLLNDTAYQLAERNVGLDSAMDYAKKAVSDEESAASKLTTSQISYPDHAQTLASFWDTLGWIYFRLNDFGVAQRYLTAAWEVSQNAVVGQHLGRLYEKQGKRLAALHMYQLAHSAAPLRVTLQSTSTTSVEKGPSIDDDLKRLGGKPDPGKAVTELNQMRTFDLPRMVKGTATATFYLLLGPGEKVEVKFVSGSDLLKSADKILGKLNYKFTFPDDGGERLPRTGILGCYPYSGCSLVFAMPSTVTFPPSFVPPTTPPAIPK